ncbi:tumor necrosis factor ligand superfamily member 10-like [Pristis pectinata]|uniref:tumor necrosis factor ligand superfamily member 10-like n=1 Tax=Pristis pectinata TaxID=685728 RepID=UPI00223E84D5|nr:tumor necrosis factor ligand superfamily member 10-like [Pristis pectinata]
MLRPGNCTVREGSVPTLSALVDNVNEPGSMPAQGNSCEHQPSVSVRIVLYMVTLLLAAHMITSTMLYAYLSVKFDKVKRDPESPLPGHTRGRGNQSVADSELLLQCIRQYLQPGSEGSRGKVAEATGFDAQKGDRPGSHRFHTPQRTAAHLIATTPGSSPPGTTFPCDKGSPIKRWMAAGFPAFTHNINYTSGKLVITEPGFYYVYCQVSFRLTSNKSERTTNVPFVQYVYLQRDPKQSTMLMKASKTPVDKSQASSFNSVNQGGVFQLKEGDQLFVSVTTTDLLSYDRATYFGTFRL